jgi:steroid delta-isomerase-like uncharacterized protein
LIRDLIEALWVGRDLDALDRFWTSDCVNHAAPGGDGIGLAEIRAYHGQFFEAFAGLSDVRIEVVQQVSEGDRVVSQIVTQARHTGPFLGVPPTGRAVTLHSIRIDRIRDGKIAEHWSVADMAGLMQQLPA